MRALRKTKKCLNCETPLAEVYDYCPMCGQQNDDKNVSIKALGKDLFENFFSFDSRLAHSVLPFLFKPGFLTNEYNEGRRFSFANPVRLYIIVSVLYFFVLNQFASDVAKEINNSTVATSAEIDSLEKVVVQELELNGLDLDSLQNEIIDKNSLRSSSVFSADSIGNNYWPLTPNQWSSFLELRKDRSISESSFYDSLHIEDRHEFTEFVIKQMIRVVKRDTEYLVGAVMKNLSVMMFFMIPVFALLLKIFYTRSKRLYINHLIHTIHIHTFSFFIYGIAMVLLHWFVKDGDLEDWVIFIAIMAVTMHSFISFMKVYHQSWKKTLIKFWLIGCAYSFVVLTALLFEVFLSFLIF